MADSAPVSLESPPEEFSFEWVFPRVVWVMVVGCIAAAALIAASIIAYGVIRMAQ